MVLTTAYHLDQQFNSSLYVSHLAGTCVPHGQDGSEHCTPAFFPICFGDSLEKLDCHVEFAAVVVSLGYTTRDIECKSALPLTISVLLEKFICFSVKLTRNININH